ncbi:hypothetical protein D3C81_1484810 [compost metagenome]
MPLLRVIGSVNASGLAASSPAWLMMRSAAIFSVGNGPASDKLNSRSRSRMSMGKLSCFSNSRSGTVPRTKSSPSTL